MRRKPGTQGSDHPTSPSQMIREFNETHGIVSAQYPTPEIVARAREKFVSMLATEASEVQRGFDTGDVVNVAQELADVVYVCFGAASELGIPLDEVLQMVHLRNLAKPGQRNKRGKVVKGDPGSEADLRAEILELLRSRGYDGDR